MQHNLHAPSAQGALWQDLHAAFDDIEQGEPPKKKAQWERLTGQERLLWRGCQAAMEEDAPAVLAALWARRHQASAGAFIQHEYSLEVWRALWALIACAQVAVQAKRGRVAELSTWAQEAVVMSGGTCQPVPLAVSAFPERDCEPVALVRAAYAALGPPTGPVGAARALTLTLLGKESPIVHSLRVHVLGTQQRKGFVASLVLEVLADGIGVWYPDPHVMAFQVMHPTFQEALKTAWQYTQTQVPLSQTCDLRWRLEGVFLPVLQGASMGLAMAVGLRCVLAGRPLYPSVGLTGAVDAHGRVRGVQDVEQKVHAARQQGLGRIIVPRDNAGEARRGAPTFAGLCTVTTVDEALTLLTALATSPESFTLTVATLQERQMIRDADLPLHMEGDYAGAKPAHVWIVLQDSYGHFYLQNPPVMFLPDGRWRAANIVPGMGIELVHFVAVGALGHAHFQRMVAGNAWGAFEGLPADSTLLRTIRIVRVKDLATMAPAAGPEELTPVLARLTFEVATLRDGQMIRSDELPLQIEGHYAAPALVHVWVILQDTYGHLYLQSPEVMFLPTGRWVASNIRPGSDILFVHFVAVGVAGHAHCQQMVARHEWGAFETLPADSMLLCTIRIVRVDEASC